MRTTRSSSRLRGSPHTHTQSRPPGSRHPPGSRPPPQEQTPLGADPFWEQAPPPPWSRPQEQADPPGADPLGAGTPPGADPPPWTETLTHATENITLPQTSFVGGNKIKTLCQKQHSFLQFMKSGSYQIYGVFWLFLCVSPERDIVSNKNYKNKGHSVCFWNFIESCMYMVDKRVKTWASDTVPKVIWHKVTWCTMVPKATYSINAQLLQSNVSQLQETPS